MYRKALTKQGSNKRGVKPQHIDMGDKKALEPPKIAGREGYQKEEKALQTKYRRDMLHYYIQIVK